MIHAFGQFHFLRMHAKDFLAAFHVGQIDRDLAVETAGAQQRGIEHIGPVGGRDDDDAFLRIEAVHLDEQGIQRLLAFVVTAADAVTAMAADRVDFVDENDARRGFLALLEHVAHAARADADEHFHEIRAADGEERHIRLAGDGAREQGLAGAGRADHEHAFRNAAAEFLEFLRVAQELDQLLDFVLRFLDAGDVLEGDLVFIPRKHAGLRLAEIQRAFAGHADLLAEEEIENQQEERDRHESDHGLRENVRLGPNRRLHARIGEFLLQVGGEIQIDRGAKRHLLRGSVAHTRPGVSAANALRRPAILDHEQQRILRIVDDLLLIEQLEEAIVGDVLLAAIAGAAAEQDRQPDQGESDREKDDAAPVEIGVAAAGFVVFGRVTIGLSHRRNRAEIARAEKLS